RPSALGSRLPGISSSPTRSGPTSVRTTSARRWLRTRAGSGGSAADELVLVAHPDLDRGDPARALARVPRRLAALRARARRRALRAARAVLDDEDAAAGRARGISRRDRGAARRGAWRGGLG